MPTERLADLSLEQLLALEVTSVSKSAERLLRAPAAIVVLTREEILRAGVTSLPEALRLAPNLQVTQYSSSRYVIGARGFGGSEESQNFSNKLLILVDGRSVYSPLFSGVYLDAQDVLLEDVDRIEVISGPGATLWGANAMNGVVNIITRPAAQTTGAFVRAGLGTGERNVGVRYGRKQDDALAWRIYGHAFERDATDLVDGDSAQDDWNKLQGGFRADWNYARDTVTFQGDAYDGDESLAGDGELDIQGQNVLARWTHRTRLGEWQVQGYYDRTRRTEPPSGAGFVLTTGDVEAQQRISSGPHRIVWGGGARFHDYAIDGTPTLDFDPDDRQLNLWNVFAQDTIGLTPTLDVTLGLKFEDAAFAGVEPLPDLRVSWYPRPTMMMWASASRAIRSPTPLDHDVVERIGELVALTGSRGFDPERVDAFEIGWRTARSSTLTLSASVFYNDYENLKSIQADPDTFFPLAFGNEMQGETYGLEAWAKWQARSWWRLSPGFRMLRKDLEFGDGAVPIFGEAQAGNDARHQVLLTSSMDLPHRVSFDANLRWVDDLPDPALDDYWELDASVGYRALPQLDVSVSALNLLHEEHREYPAPVGALIQRSVIAQARWTF
ncbi:MAG TPA: TonB-dependent receptor [Nevskiaceae bacterium]|nr:TonB-dependent receptor [Nevskiaceae bacterium]